MALLLSGSIRGFCRSNRVPPITSARLVLGQGLVPVCVRWMSLAGKSRKTVGV
ncbi:MAG: hypothetical protein ACRER2_04800 [Methylococcales bacterium]